MLLKHVRSVLCQNYKCDDPINEWDFVKRNNAYKLRKPSEFAGPKVLSVFHGKESISYLGPQIWDMIPVEMKNLKTISAFKKEVKNWKLENCPCRLCKPYIHNVGFI